MAKWEISEVSSLASVSNPKLKQANLQKREIKNKIPNSKSVRGEIGNKISNSKSARGEIGNKISNTKSVRGSKSLPRDAPRFPSPYAPEIRMPAKSPVNTAPGQFPKSPLASLFVKNQLKENKVNFLPVTVNVLGSAGPMKFLATDSDSVEKVIETALKSYARGRRLPVFGQNIKQFELHCPSTCCGQALDPFETIGGLGTRNFLLCKKLEGKVEEEEEERVTTTSDRDHQKTNLRKNCLNTICLGF